MIDHDNTRNLEIAIMVQPAARLYPLRSPDIVVGTITVDRTDITVDSTAITVDST